MIGPPPRGYQVRGIEPNPVGRPKGNADQDQRPNRASRVTPEYLRARQLRIARSIARALASAMTSAGVSCEELAAAVDCGKSAVFAHAAGRSTPTIWTLIAYSAALRCSLVDLLGEEALLP